VAKWTLQMFIFIFKITYIYIEFKV